MLRPELQDMDTFVEGMDNMVGAHKRAAEAYFEDGSIEGACPPLKALLYIMKDGNYQGKTLEDPEIRNLFNSETIKNSEWYYERLLTRQQIETNTLQNVINSLQKRAETDKSINDELNNVRATLKQVKSIGYLKSIVGTIGADPYIL